MSNQNTSTAVAERWAAVSEWPDYDISSLGRVRNGERVLRPQVSGSGYRFVSLRNRGLGRAVQVHRLVALAFCGYGKEVNHKDGNKFNNCADNLEWVTRSENQRHAADTGLKPTGETSHLCTKLTADKVRWIRALCDSGFSQSSISKVFGISQTYVGKLHRRTKWRQLN